MQPRVPLRQALQDRSLLGQTLKGPSWQPWRTLLIAACGEPLVSEQERATFKQLTQRDREPGQMVEELCVIAGRRGGKSRAISVLATWIGGLCNHPRLVPGERGIILVVSADTRQSSIVLDYVSANFDASPMLKQLVEGRTQTSLRLANKIDIEFRAANFRTLRGPTYVCCVVDEGAFLYSNEDAANLDSEIVNAVRPGLSTTGGPLIMISSPYARRGVLWDSFRKNYGPDGDSAILVAKGSSREFNPSLPESVVTRAYERDAASASAEYGGEFRTDLEQFVSIEVVMQGTIGGVIERPPAMHHGVKHFAFVDMSGGSVDSSALAVGHFDYAKQSVVVDLLRERVAPHSPEQVTEEFSRELKRFGIGKVISDRYAGSWVIEQFARFGIQCEQSAKPKSDLYVGLLALLNSRRIELPDNQKLRNQLVGLERRTARGGRDSIDHAPGQHDDCANAIAGLAAILTEQPMDYGQLCRNFNGSAAAEGGVEAANDDWRRLRRTLYYESAGTFDLNRRR
jgi:hypothetical protein